MATVGYGDLNLADQPDWLKVYDIGLMGMSALLLASFLALVTEELVSSRIDAALGRYPRPRSGHIVVCGLGKAGARIIAGLHDLDVPCVGIEQDAGAPGIAIARSLKIPVVLADARTPGTLDELHLDRARALMAMTNDDLANVQAAMTAREHNPDLRIVLRCFDARLAERLDHSIELDLTRSVEALAAPAFVAALLGRQVAEALPLSNVPLGVLEVEVGDGPFAGATVAELEAAGDLRVLTCGTRWRPRPDYPIALGDVLGVVGTRDACDRLLVARGDEVAAS
jgi:Trk K+ transport system NAD-binding subunit